MEDNRAYEEYLQGSKAGLQHENKGQDTKTLADGSMFEVYRSHFKWNVGLTVRDWRSTCRIAKSGWNIEVKRSNTKNYR